MRLKGSYTVEAALLMTLMIPLLTGLIYLGFYLHDTAMLKGAAWETAAFISLHNHEEDIEKRAKEKVLSLVRTRALGIKQVFGDVSVDKKQAEVNCCGQMAIPGFLLNYFFKKRLEISASASADIGNPTKTIHKIRGAEKLLGSKGDGD